MMVMIQINLTEEENKIVNIVKSVKGFITKEEAIKYVINQFKPKLKI